MKKILIILAVLTALSAFWVNICYQRAPGLLVRSIEKALNKKVIIRSVEYTFPGSFELAGFEVKEKGRFEGETSFYADRISLRVSWLSIPRKALVVDKIKVANAQVIIREFDGKLTHSLTEAVKKKAPGPPAEGAVRGEAGPAGLPLEIHQFSLEKSHFRFIDYDAQEGGFVIALDEIDARIRNIRLPLSASRISYEAGARLSQGRDQRPAEIKVTGWTAPQTADTDANLQANAVYLPFFRPYYAQVTQAAIQDGYLDARANLHIDKKDLTLNVDLEIIGLLFQSYEADNQLFGLKAEELLSFLKDRSGRLKFQFVARWNLADRSVRARDVMRKSIERSLKATILGNLENILEHTLQKVGEQGIVKTKEDLEDKVKKLKEFFKY
ncbi:MAG: DUF748 domain-containing protein [Candidatus Omnitrophota bacterium]